MTSNTVTFENPSLSLRLSFSIVDYQFPNKKAGSNANWLIVEIQCAYKGREFTSRDPSLLTGDLKGLSDWFLAIPKNEIPEWITLSFIEPNLEFKLYRSIDGMVRIGIELSYETKPPFCIDELRPDGFDSEDNFMAIFECPREQMEEYAQQFEILGKCYPPREEEDPVTKSSRSKTNEHFLNRMINRMGNK